MTDIYGGATMTIFADGAADANAGMIRPRADDVGVSKLPYYAIRALIAAKWHTMARGFSEVSSRSYTEKIRADRLLAQTCRRVHAAQVDLGQRQASCTVRDG